MIRNLLISAAMIIMLSAGSGCVSSGGGEYNQEQSHRFVSTTSSIIYASYLYDKDPEEQRQVSQDILEISNKVREYLNQPMSLSEVRNLTVAYIQASDLENKPLVTIILDSVVIMLQDEIGDINLPETERTTAGKALVAEALRSISNIAELYADPNRSTTQPN